MSHLASYENGTKLRSVADWSYLRIEPVPRFVYLLLCSYITTITAFALLGNGIFLVTSYKSKNLQRPIHFMLRNLAVTDFCSALFGGCINITTTAAGYFYLGQVVCDMEGFVIGTFGIVNLTIICILSFSRYLVVCRPFGVYVPQVKHGRYALLFAWLWAIIWNLPPLLWGGYDLEGIGTHCGPNWNTRHLEKRIYLILLMAFCYFGKLITLATCYANIVMTIRKTRTASSIHSRKSQEAERDVIKIVMSIMIAFLICWTPYTMVAIMAVSRPGMQVNQYVGTIPVYFAKSATVLNPIIYVLMNSQIRKEVIRVALNGNSRRDDEASNDSNTRRTSVLFLRRGSSV